MLVDESGRGSARRSINDGPGRRASAAKDSERRRVSAIAIPEGGAGSRTASRHVVRAKVRAQRLPGFTRKRGDREEGEGGPRIPNLRQGRQVRGDVGHGYSLHIRGSARSFSNNSVIAQTIASARSGEPGP